MALVCGLCDYQQKAALTAIYPQLADVAAKAPAGVCNIYYAALGLAGEAGEVANKVKKIMRDDGGTITAARRVELRKELGDVLWYLAATATELGLSLQEIAVANIEELASRKERSVLTGAGDNR